MLGTSAAGVSMTSTNGSAKKFSVMYACGESDCEEGVCTGWTFGPRIYRLEKRRRLSGRRDAGAKRLRSVEFPRTLLHRTARGA